MVTINREPLSTSKKGATINREPLLKKKTKIDALTLKPLTEGEKKGVNLKANAVTLAGKKADLAVNRAVNSAKNNKTLPGKNDAKVAKMMAHLFKD